MPEIIPQSFLVKWWECDRMIRSDYILKEENSDVSAEI